ncbi:hypothetical protein PZH37_05265 [[Eubacterium] siraeum]|nr:hypothetical protein [[Eubacterium] siraeum]
MAEKANTGFGAAVGFLQEYEQKKTGTARESVTRLTMPLVQAGQEVTSMTNGRKIVGLFCGRIFLRKRLSVL